MDLRYEYFESIDSTNDEIKRRLSENAAEEGLVISAGMRTAGRGRSGHEWSSPPGSSVATSLLVRPIGVDSDAIPRITILAACAVAGYVETLAGDRVGIKWPNDVMIGEKKMSGILVERIMNGEDVSVITGIGVNLAAGSYPPELTDRATSIEEQTGTKPLFEDVLCGIWERFAGIYEDFVRTQSLVGVLDLYNGLLMNRDRKVIVKDPAGEYEATALRADEQGRLVVKMPDGMCRAIDSGEVSVRGIDGYI